MPSYDMLTEFDFLDVKGFRKYDDVEKVHYWRPDGTKVDDGYSHNFITDYKNGLVSFVCIWDGPEISNSRYKVLAARESWYMLEGTVSFTNTETGKLLKAEPGQVATIRRGDEVVINATPFRVMFIILNLPEKDMAKMTGQDSNFVLEPIPGDGPTWEGPRTRRAD